MLVRGSTTLSGSFYVLKPNPTSTDDFKVRTATFRTLNICVCYLRNKMDGFSSGFIKFFKVKLPSGSANSAFKR